MRAAKRLLRYIRGATRLGVVYGDDKPPQGYVDAEWAGDIDARRSTTVCYERRWLTNRK